MARGGADDAPCRPEVLAHPLAAAGFGEGRARDGKTERECKQRQQEGDAPPQLAEQTTHSGIDGSAETEYSGVEAHRLHALVAVVQVADDGGVEHPQRRGTDALNEAAGEQYGE